MTTTNISVQINSVQVTNCPANFLVSETEYDLGRPTGNGSTLERAIEDFKESWMMKFDEEINVNII